MIDLNFEAVRQVQGMKEQLADVKNAIEQRFNISEYSDNVRPVLLSMSTTMRVCLLVGLSDDKPRDMNEVATITVSKVNEPYPGSFFTKGNIKKILSALIKMRYHNLNVLWESPSQLTKILGCEMLRGREILMRDGALDEWLRFNYAKNGKARITIPALNLHIGTYDNGMDAYLDINNREISNTQMLIAGATGSGKTNLLAVLLQQMRSATVDTAYPVNFLLFDYKGEFSDPTNSSWLELFETDRTAILNPMDKPLPFTPFKDFSDMNDKDIHIYSTTMSKALTSIAVGDARLSTNMDNRLSNAIFDSYKKNNGKPVTFKQILDTYMEGLPEGRIDSVASVLMQMVKVPLFSDEDKIDLVGNSYIINLGRCPKEGVYAKAVMYFVISKLYDICEKMQPQTSDDERYEIRHFSVIDEAHYMLRFDNQPLQDLIKIGRSKGMSVILATQDMKDFKSRRFDFFANVQYPMIMLQQSQDDSVLKDLFGVSGLGLSELKQVISTLRKGELIIKDTSEDLLGLGNVKKYKKIKVTHLI